MLYHKCMIKSIHKVTIVQIVKIDIKIKIVLTCIEIVISFLYYIFSLLLFINLIIHIFHTNIPENYNIKIFTYIYKKLKS